MAKKRTCTICGKQYEYCGHCPNKNTIEPWRNLYCSENCRDAFVLFGDYKTNKKDAVEVKNILSLWGISPEKVREIHKPIVSEIFDKGTVATKVEIPTKEEKSEEIITTVELDESTSIEDDNASKKNDDVPFYKKNRKKKVQEKKEQIVNED